MAPRASRIGLHTSSTEYSWPSRDNSDVPGGRCALAPVSNASRDGLSMRRPLSDSTKRSTSSTGSPQTSDARHCVSASAAGFMYWMRSEASTRDHGFIHGVEHRAQLVALPRQRALRLGPDGDVGAGEEHAVHALGGAVGHQRHLHVAAFRICRLVIERDGLPGERLGERLGHRFAPLRPEHLEQRAPGDALARDAEPLLVQPVGELVAPIAAQVGEQHGNAVGQPAQPLLPRNRALRARSRRDSAIWRTASSILGAARDDEVAVCQAGLRRIQGPDRGGGSSRRSDGNRGKHACVARARSPPGPGRGPDPSRRCRGAARRAGRPPARRRSTTRRPRIPARPAAAPERARSCDPAGRPEQSLVAWLESPGAGFRPRRLGWRAPERSSGSPTQAGVCTITAYAVRLSSRGETFFSDILYVPSYSTIEHSRAIPGFPSIPMSFGMIHPRRGNGPAGRQIGLDDLPHRLASRRPAPPAPSPRPGISWPASMGLPSSRRSLMRLPICAFGAQV